MSLMNSENEPMPTFWTTIIYSIFQVIFIKVLSLVISEIKDDNLSHVFFILVLYKNFRMAYRYGSTKNTKTVQ